MGKIAVLSAVNLQPSSIIKYLALIGYILFIYVCKHNCLNLLENGAIKALH